MRFWGNQETSEHDALDLNSPDDTLISIAYLAERILSDLLILGNDITDKISVLESERRCLKIENEKLKSELRLSRESEEQAYEKLKLLREESRITNTVWTDSEAATIESHTCICLAYPSACSLTARSWSSDISHDQQLSNCVLTLERRGLGTDPIQSSKKIAPPECLERELLSVRVSLAKAQAREEELKCIVDRSRRRDGYTGELISLNEELKMQLAAAHSELDKLWRRDKILGQELSASTKTLSMREQEVSLLSLQVISISRLLTQRDDHITRLETLLGEEQMRSRRNREVAAKVGSAAAQCRAEEMADIKRLRAQRHVLRQEVKRLQNDNAKLVSLVRAPSENDTPNSLLPIPSRRLSKWIQAIACSQHSSDQEPKGKVQKRISGACGHSGWVCDERVSLKSEEPEDRVHPCETTMGSAGSEEENPPQCLSSRSHLCTEFAIDHVHGLESQNVDLMAKLGSATRRLEQEQLVVVALKAEVALLRSEMAGHRWTNGEEVRGMRESASLVPGSSAQREGETKPRLSPQSLNRRLRAAEEGKIELKKQLDESRKLLSKEMLLVSELQREICAVKMACSEKSEVYYKSYPVRIASGDAKIDSLIAPHDLLAPINSMEYKSTRSPYHCNPVDCAWTVLQVQADTTASCSNVLSTPDAVSRSGSNTDACSRSKPIEYSRVSLLIDEIACFRNEFAELCQCVTFPAIQDQIMVQIHEILAGIQRANSELQTEIDALKSLSVKQEKAFTMLSELQNGQQQKDPAGPGSSTAAAQPEHALNARCTETNSLSRKSGLNSYTDVVAQSEKTITLPQSVSAECQWNPPAETMMTLKQVLGENLKLDGMDGGDSILHALMKHNPNTCGNDTLCKGLSHSSNQSDHFQNRSTPCEPTDHSVSTPAPQEIVVCAARNNESRCSDSLQSLIRPFHPVHVQEDGGNSLNAVALTPLQSLENRENCTLSSNTRLLEVTRQGSVSNIALDAATAQQISNTCTWPFARNFPEERASVIEVPALGQSSSARSDVKYPPNDVCEDTLVVRPEQTDEKTEEVMAEEVDVKQVKELTNFLESLLQIIRDRKLDISCMATSKPGGPCRNSCDQLAQEPEFQVPVGATVSESVSTALQIQDIGRSAGFEQSSCVGNESMSLEVAATLLLNHVQHGRQDENSSPRSILLDPAACRLLKQISARKLSVFQAFDSLCSATLGIGTAQQSLETTVSSIQPVAEISGTAAVVPSMQAVSGAVGNAMVTLLDPDSITEFSDACGGAPSFGDPVELRQAEGERTSESQLACNTGFQHEPCKVHNLDHFMGNPSEAMTNVPVDSLLGYACSNHSRNASTEQLTKGTSQLVQDALQEVDHAQSCALKAQVSVASNQVEKPMQASMSLPFAALPTCNSSQNQMMSGHAKSAGAHPSCDTASAQRHGVFEVPTLRRPSSWKGIIQSI